MTEKSKHHPRETDIKYSICIRKTFHIEYFGNWVFGACSPQKHKTNMPQNTAMAKRCTFIQIFLTSHGWHRRTRNYDRSPHIVHLLVVLRRLLCVSGYTYGNIIIICVATSHIVWSTEWKHEWLNGILGTNYSCQSVGCASGCLKCKFRCHFTESLVRIGEKTSNAT